MCGQRGGREQLSKRGKLKVSLRVRTKLWLVTVSPVQLNEETGSAGGDGYARHTVDQTLHMYIEYHTALQNMYSYSAKSIKINPKRQNKPCVMKMTPASATFLFHSLRISNFFLTCSVSGLTCFHYIRNGSYKGGRSWLPNLLSEHPII